MSLKKVKVMIAGPVNGRLDLLQARVATINASKVGPFDLVLCTGRFTPTPADGGDDAATAAAATDPARKAQFGDFLTGAKKMPVPTYFLAQGVDDGGFARDSPDGAQVAENLFFLGRAGVRVLGGLTVGFVCDASDASARAAVVAAATKAAPEGLDVLLSSEWPEGVLNFTPVASDPLSDAQQAATSVGMQDIAKRVCPRYHFAASAGNFVQRAPFSSPATSSAAVLFTRFVAIAAVSESTDKQRKWLHALSLAPAKALLAAGGDKQLAQLQVLPGGCTSNPFYPRPPPPPVDDDFDSGPIHADGPVVKKPRILPMPQVEPAGVWSAARAAELDRLAGTQQVQSFFFGDTRRGRGRGGGRGGGGGLPPGYVCRICNQPGHHIRDCPQAASNQQGGGGGAGGGGAGPSSRPLPAGYVCKICSIPGHSIRDCPQGKAETSARQADGGAPGGRGRRPRPPRDPNARCWFCLGSAGVETHLITSIGKAAYLAMPKGAINDGHILIIPISHDVRSLADSPPDVRADVAAYKAALSKLYASKGRAAVFFERAIAITQSQSHAFVEALSVPQAKADELGPLFIELGGKVNIDFQVVADFDSAIEEMDGGSEQYFCVELPDETCLLHRFSGFNPKAVQFGRTVLTRLLGCPHRRDWKACRVPKEEEEKLAQNFKKGFESFDPFSDDEDSDDDDDDE